MVVCKPHPSLTAPTLARFVTLLLVCVLARPLPLPALGMSQELLRGLEDHSARFQLGHSFGGLRDSLRLELRAEWREGFRAYNRDSRRVLQQSLIDGTHLLGGPWRVRWNTRQSLFNERRSLRETLAQSLEGGIGHAGGIRAEALAGWMQERRQRGQDQGPRLSLGLGSSGRTGGVVLDGRGRLELEFPGTRRNQRQEAQLNAAWRGPDDTRNTARLLVREQREDAYPDPLDNALERRGGLDLELENHYRGKLGPGAQVVADVQAWKRRQERNPRREQDSTATRADFQDLGVEFRLSPAVVLGIWRARAGMVFLRQSQVAEYGALGFINGTRSAIGRQRLEGSVACLPGLDSLSVFAATELRRRDTDFEGSLRRDPDDMDQARREGAVRWSRSLGRQSRLGLELGLILSAERHVQASRSRANYLGRTWRMASDHAMGVGQWQLRGRGQVVADYRLFDFDEALEPRSWIQRRLLLQEKARRPLPGLFGERWRWVLEHRARWVEEDGGTFLKQDGIERISDSAREWQLGCALEGRRQSWTMLPGWDWLERRDWDWTGTAAGRERELVRWQRRQGPQLALTRSAASFRLKVETRWEWTREEIRSRVLHRRDVWARVEWAWKL